MLNRLFAADDWGLSPAVNEGILALARRGWLSSVSCMANTPFISHGLTELLSLSPQIRFALHFNLTFGKPLSPPERVESLIRKSSAYLFNHQTLMFKCFSGRIDPEHVFIEAKAQLLALLGKDIPVSLLDGHHHIHFLPVISGALKRLSFEYRFDGVRLMRDPSHFFSFLQSQCLAGDWPIPLQDVCYLLRKDLRNRSSFMKKLKFAAGRPLVVHPATHNDFDVIGVNDNLREQRIFELHSIFHFLDNQ